MVLITSTVAPLEFFNRGVHFLRDKVEMQSCERHFYVFTAGCEGVNAATRCRPASIIDTVSRRTTKGVEVSAAVM